jgi:hypothetical protein
MSNTCLIVKAETYPVTQQNLYENKQLHAMQYPVSWYHSKSRMRERDLYTEQTT